LRAQDRRRANQRRRADRALNQTAT